MRTASRLLLLVGLLLGGGAFACAVCGQATEQQNLAYLLMTLMLSFVPLLALGGAAYWLYRRILAAERAERLPPPPAPALTPAAGPDAR